MHTFYRAFRTLELMGKIKRGGNALFVGAGLALDEVSAFYVEPPSDYWLRVAYRPDAFKTLMAKITIDVPGNIEESARFKVGSAISFDPRTDIEDLIKSLSPIIAPTTLHHYELGIRGFTDTYHGTPFDTIVINRADPEVFRQFAQKDDPDKRSAIARLAAFLKPEGSFCITVGSGNSNRERSQRKTFVLSGCDNELKSPNFEVFKNDNHRTAAGRLLFASQHDIPEMLTARHILKEKLPVPVVRGGGPRRIK